jgi:hypothetical protein
MMPYIRELGEKSGEAAHTGADQKRCEKHPANVVEAHEELFCVKCATAVHTAVLFNRSEKKTEIEIDMKFIKKMKIR